MRRDEIARLLPAVFQLALRPVEGWGLEPDLRLEAYLDVMESFHEPMEHTLQQLDGYLDPRRAPSLFVPWLCGWVDLDWLVPDTARGTDVGGDELISTGLGRLREIVALTSELIGARGTAQGLEQFLRTVTGLPDISVSDDPVGADGSPTPFHVVVHVPHADAGTQPLIERIVAMEAPAYTTWAVVYGPGG